MGFLVFFSFVFSIFCYFVSDPMKSSFFLVMTALISMPVISFSMNVWYSYFISLLFLSGIFVILVYFSSLSGIVGGWKSMVFVLCVLTSFLLFFYSVYYMSLCFSINNFYWSFCLFVFFVLVFVLLFFMNFTSYYLNFLGALRKF